MANEAVTQLVTQYIEAVWNRGDVLALERLTTPGFQYVLGGQAPRNRTAMAEFLVKTREAFPDWRVEIAEVISDENSAAVRWEGVVTHAGMFHGILPTGRRVKVAGINLYRLAHGRIDAEWEQMDSLGILGQLGFTGSAPAL